MHHTEYTSMSISPLSTCEKIVTNSTLFLCVYNDSSRKKLNDYIYLEFLL